MRKILAVSTAAALGVIAAPVTAYAYSGSATVCHASFSQHPESGAGWAVDTFTRTTTIRAAGKGWKVHIKDSGTFTTVPGKPSDGDNSVPIENTVTGSLRGRGDYAVTGSGTPKCPTTDSYSGATGPSTGDWPKHFWAGTVTASGIDPWHWRYDTTCEHMTEDSRFSKVDGNIVGKVCPTKPTPPPTSTPTPNPSTSTSTPAPTDSSTPTTPPSQAPVPTPVKSDLPVTG